MPGWKMRVGLVLRVEGTCKEASASFFLPQMSRTRSALGVPPFGQTFRVVEGPLQRVVPQASLRFATAECPGRLLGRRLRTQRRRRGAAPAPTAIRERRRETASLRFHLDVDLVRLAQPLNVQASSAGTMSGSVQPNFMRHSIASRTQRAWASPWAGQSSARRTSSTSSTTDPKATCGRA